MYVSPVKHQTSHWSEQYIDTIGGDTLVTTLSVPLFDKQKQVGVIV